MRRVIVLVPRTIIGAIVSAVVPQLKARLDYDDYATIPADGKRYELLDGEVYVTPAPSPFHQRASKRLQRELERYFEEAGRGEVFNAPIDLILTFHDVVQPDLVVVGDPSQVSARAIEGVPILVVEVLSPSNRAYDRATKAHRYATLGVPHFWIVDPDEKTVECYELRAQHYRVAAIGQADSRLTHPAFPGLEIDLGRIWR